MTPLLPLRAAVLGALLALLPTSALAQATPDAATAAEVPVAVPATEVAAPPAPPEATTLEAAIQEQVEKVEAEGIAEILVDRRGEPDVSGAEDVIVPVAFFLFLAFVIALPMVLKARQARSRGEIARLIVERGGSIPSELLVPPTPPRSDLRRGILLTALGLASVFFFLAVASDEPGVATLGLIPLFLGLGYLLYWWIERRRDTATRAP